MALGEPVLFEHALSESISCANMYVFLHWLPSSECLVVSAVSFHLRGKSKRLLSICNLIDAGY